MSEIFFIAGLPRSRSAWLANLFTHGDSVCFHDGSKHGLSCLIQFMKASKSKYVGDSDSGLTFFHEELHKEFPNAKWLFIHRNRDESQAGYIKAFQPKEPIITTNKTFDLLENNYEVALNYLKSKNAAVKEFTFNELKENFKIRSIWNYLTPDSPLNEDRLKMLQDFRITIIPEKVKSVWQ